MLTEQSIRLPNGVTLRYVEQGPADAMPLILLHGFPDSWLSYETVLANLPSPIRTIALSQRGFGNSDKPEGSYHPRDLAADLADFMKAAPHSAGHRGRTFDGRAGGAALRARLSGAGCRAGADRHLQDAARQCPSWRS